MWLHVCCVAACWRPRGRASGPAESGCGMAVKMFGGKALEGWLDARPSALVLVTSTVAVLLTAVPQLRPIPLFFLFACGISLDKRLAGWFRLRFPRSAWEIHADTERFFAMLRDCPLVAGRSPLPAQSRVVEVRQLGKLVAEPAKNATSCGLQLVYCAPGSEEQPSTLDVFVKFQCGRGLLLWVQAIRSALDPGVSREVLFYQRLAHRVPLRVAQPYYASAAHWCNRVCIVLEHLGDNAVIVPDWKGGTEAQLSAIVTGVAAMHARWWGLTATDQGTNWIKAKKGLEYADFVTGFIKKVRPCMGRSDYACGARM